jgi:phospholipid/cholesterol/gamma-HCH transport system permease protein
MACLAGLTLTGGDQENEPLHISWAGHFDSMLDSLARIGRIGLRAAARFGRAHLLLLGILRGLPSALASPSLLLAQIHDIGVRSTPLVAVSGLFVGMVLALQGYHVLSDFGAEEDLGRTVAVSLVRELGPLITALLVAGRAGSALTAEIGLMRATEQLPGLQERVIDPVQRILTPRFFGGVVALPLLAAIFSTLGIFGGWLVGVELLGVDDGAYWSRMQTGTDPCPDVYNGAIKSLVFGVLVAWIALFQGYETSPTPDRMSRATTRSLVHAALAVLALDFVLTSLMFGE